MAMVYVLLIIKGKKTFLQVPNTLKAQVADILVNDMELPELVPVEYGGTMVVQHKRWA